MLFVDEALISVFADGYVHFRLEKYVPKGGPDGGMGGDVIFEAVENIHTLSDFRHQKIFRAQNGTPGDQNNRTDARGEDLIIKVPVGTIIKTRPPPTGGAEKRR